MSPIIADLFARSGPLVVSLKPGEAHQRGTKLYILSIVLVIVAGVFVAARISARLSKSTTIQGLGQDDYCVIASLVSSFQVGFLTRANRPSTDLIRWIVSY
jgi:hypothetical protein